MLFREFRKNENGKKKEGLLITRSPPLPFPLVPPGTLTFASLDY